MLINEGDRRTPRADLMLACLLALVAGGVNSAGFMAFRFFSANMTGNVSMASELLVAGPFDLALAFLTVVALFILGAVLATLLIDHGKRRGWSAVYAMALLLEAAILSAAGLVSAVGVPPSHAVLVVGALSLAMGIQNAASSRISANRVRTTHVSGAATDLGIELARLLGPVRGREREELRFRLTLHLSTIASFAFGGMLGVLGYHSFGSFTFVAFSLPLVGLSGWYARRLTRAQ